MNLTCLHVLQHMDWEAAKEQAQAPPSPRGQCLLPASRDLLLSCPSQQSPSYPHSPGHLPSSPQSSRSPQALDSDGDGLVSHDEILALVKECVPTRDADSDGNISNEEYLDYVKKRVTAGKTK